MRIDPHHLAVALELPRRGIAPLEKRPQQAGVVEQLARVLRPAMAIEIGGRGGGGEALDARPDRHRDHVLLQPLRHSGCRHRQPAASTSTKLSSAITSSRMSG